MVLNTPLNSPDALRQSFLSHDDYELIAPLGQGGMGFVFRALDKRHKREVALKVFVAHSAGPEYSERFRREAKTLVELHHPNIVRILDYGQHRGLSYYAMELLQGENLEVLIQQCWQQNMAPAAQNVAPLFEVLARALDYCHNRDVVHRDIKPANIIVRGQQLGPAIVDFGLAKSFQKSDDLVTLSRSGEVLGTLDYLSPEQIAPQGGFGERGPKIDVWALGVCIFYAMTGRKPYPGQNLVEIFELMRKSKAPSLKSLNSSVPDWLDDLVGRMLERQVMERPSMSQVAASLARPLSSTGHFQISDSVLHQSPAAPQSPRSWGAVAASFVLGALLMTLLSAFNGAPEEPLRVYVEPLPKATQARTVTLSGFVSKPEAKIFVNGQPLDIRIDGQFERQISLKPGNNEIHFTPLEAEAKQQHARNWSIHCDRQPPQIELPALHGQSLLAVGRELSFRGRVLDANPKSMTVQGQDVALTDDGSFYFHSAESWSEGQSITLIAEDSVGHKTLKSVIVTKTVQGPQILYDRLSWNRATDEQQDLAIRRVAEQHKPWLSFLGAKTFKCGSISHRIGRFKHKMVDIEMLLIPGGRYEMGLENIKRELDELLGLKLLSADEKGDVETLIQTATPKHDLYIPPFFLARTETTEQQLFKFVESNEEPGSGPAQPDHPEVGVVFYQAREWLKSNDFKLRLPTEAEWEYAARAGSRDRYFWGSTPQGRYAWFADNSDGQTHSWREHESSPNAFGLIDMAGNVWEIVEDDWLPDYQSGPLDHRPRYTKHPLIWRYGVARGGAFSSRRPFQGITMRLKIERDAIAPNLGVRFAMSLQTK